MDGDWQGEERMEEREDGERKGGGSGMREYWRKRQWRDRMGERERKRWRGMGREEQNAVKEKEMEDGWREGTEGELKEGWMHDANNVSNSPMNLSPRLNHTNRDVDWHLSKRLGWGVINFFTSSFHQPNYACVRRWDSENVPPVAW